MQKLSAEKLAETVKNKRKEKDMTQEKLSEATGINRVIIGRIEQRKYVPSINQIESLAEVLEFDLTDMFIEKDENNSFIALRSEALSDQEKQGVDNLFKMMLTLKQQILIRSKQENELLNQS